MLRFAIGLGINSVSGALIERALARIPYVLDDFEIVPIDENDYELESLVQVQHRATRFARQARHFFTAGVYFGVASGICIFKDGPKDKIVSAPARIDIAVAIVDDKPLPPQTLDPMDIRSQMTNRVCGLASTKKSVADLVTYVRKHCDYKALPPPRK